MSDAIIKGLIGFQLMIGAIDSAACYELMCQGAWGLAAIMALVAIFVLGIAVGNISKM